jgi:hypothetical protein
VRRKFGGIFFHVTSRSSSSQKPTSCGWLAFVLQVTMHTDQFASFAAFFTSFCVARLMLVSLEPRWKFFSI